LLVQKELEIWQFAAKQLKRGGEVMLLVVTESSGSSPGRQGFKMIVAGDEMRGSIGGGVMEVSLVEQAKVKSKKAKGKRQKWECESYSYFCLFTFYFLLCDLLSAEDRSKI
jgi:hypothetical protein